MDEVGAPYELLASGITMRSREMDWHASLIPTRQIRVLRSIKCVALGEVMGLALMTLNTVAFALVVTISCAKWASNQLSKVWYCHAGRCPNVTPNVMDKRGKHERT